MLKNGRWYFTLGPLSSDATIPDRNIFWSTAMCVNYHPPTPEMFNGRIGAFSQLPRDWQWPEETWKDYDAPILCAATG
jgi:hypothetical protein